MTEGIRDNVGAARFELVVADETAFASYHRQAGLLAITYVYAPPSLRGTGAADRLMEGVAALARSEGERILPLCGYARAWLTRIMLTATCWPDGPSCVSQTGNRLGRLAG